MTCGQIRTRTITAAAMIGHYATGYGCQKLDRVNVMTTTWRVMDPYSWHKLWLYCEQLGCWSVTSQSKRFTAGGIPASSSASGFLLRISMRGGGISGPYQHGLDTQSNPDSLQPDSAAAHCPDFPVGSTTAQVPYLVNNLGTPSFLSYDDEQSMPPKVKLAATWAWAAGSSGIFPRLLSDRNPHTLS